MARESGNTKAARASVEALLKKRAPNAVAELLDEAVQLREIEIAKILPNPTQPRRLVQAEGVAELADSLREHGLLQPILVRPNDGGYTLIAGSRRLRAAESLGWARIKALVMGNGDPELLALIENLQREALDPIDEAEAIQALKDRLGITFEQLAAKLGKSRSSIAEVTGILRLPKEILDEVRTLAAAGTPLSRSSLVELGRIEGPEQLRAAWERLAKGEGGRAEVRALRRSADRASPKSKLSVQTATTRIARLESLLSTRIYANLWQREETQDALRRLRDRIDAVLAGG
jgi:ParB family chromosome partitioning protein